MPSTFDPRVEFKITTTNRIIISAVVANESVFILTEDGDVFSTVVIPGLEIALETMNKKYNKVSTIIAKEETILIHRSGELFITEGAELIKVKEVIFNANGH